MDFQNLLKWGLGGTRASKMLPQRHQNETHLAKVDFAKYALSLGREHTFSMLEGPGRLAGGTRRPLGRPSRATLGLQEDIGKLSSILEAKSTENELIWAPFWGANRTKMVTQK